MDCANRLPLARPSGGVRWLEHGIQTLPQMDQSGRVLPYFRALAEDANFEYTMIDGTINKVHRHGQGAKGGLKARLSDALAAA